MMKNTSQVMKDASERLPKRNFMKTESSKEFSTAAFDFHASKPDVSSDTYFAIKHLALKEQLAERKLLYLDTNHWINLRHVVLNSPSEKPHYRGILNLLQDLRRDGRIYCPISFFLFMELMKQNDSKTRLTTANLMDALSGGICFQFPPEIARIELRQFFVASLQGQERRTRAWVWTKIGFLGGETLPELAAMPQKAMAVIQKGWIDLMWSFRLIDILETVESLPAMDFWERYAAAANDDAAAYRSMKISYDDVLQREKALLIRKLLNEELPSIGKELLEAFPECRDLSNLAPPADTDYSPWNLPSLQILAGISAADLVTTKKFNSHDILDFRHAALAIPYCDAIFCDGPMATRLRNKPCDFSNVYGTTILGKSEEIYEFLKTLAT